MRGLSRMIDGCSSLAVEISRRGRDGRPERRPGGSNPQRALEAIPLRARCTSHRPARTGSRRGRRAVGGARLRRELSAELDGWTNREMAVKPAAAMHIELRDCAARGAVSAGGRAAQVGPTGRRCWPYAQGALRRRPLREAAGRRRANRLLALPSSTRPTSACCPSSRASSRMISVHSERTSRPPIQFVQDEKLKASSTAPSRASRRRPSWPRPASPSSSAPSMTCRPSGRTVTDAIFRNAGLMAKAGVKVAFSSSSASVARTSPTTPPRPAAFGLDKRGPQAVTINTAEIFGWPRPWAVSSRQARQHRPGRQRHPRAPDQHQESLHRRPRDRPFEPLHRIVEKFKKDKKRRVKPTFYR